VSYQELRCTSPKPRHRVTTVTSLPAPLNYTALGWTLVLNPDGTTTAWNKDRTKVLHSHSPPARTG
jgi:hypothetical protein